MSGRPLDLRWADENVPAILQAWYPGTRGGDAVAAVLFGDVSPAGRLPFTWPRHVGHVPMVYSHLRTFEPQEQGKRYWDEPSTPLYPFGHGLSYASFEYNGPAAGPRRDRRRRDGHGLGRRHEHLGPRRATRSCSSTSTSATARPRARCASSRASSAWRSPPARPRTVTFDLGPDELRYWSAATRDWVQDATTFDVWVGGDSTAELATTFVVTSA